MFGATFGTEVTERDGATLFVTVDDVSVAGLITGLDAAGVALTGGAGGEYVTATVEAVDSPMALVATTEYV